MNFKKILTSVLAAFSALIFTYTNCSSIADTTKYKTIPIDILSEGGINASFAAKFALFLAILLLTTIFVGKLLKTLFKLPTVAGQIIGGIFLGPSLFNIKNVSYFSEPLTFINNATKQIYAIASSDLYFFFVLLISSALTVAYLLWLAGHETDVQDMAKVGLEATLAGFLGTLVPIFMITGTIYFLFGSTYSLAACVGLGVVFAATSVSIPVAMLISQKKMHLRSSKATMGAAIVDDILAIILFSIFIVLLQTGLLGKIHCATNVGHYGGITSSLLNMLLVFVIMFVGGKYFIKPVTLWLKNMKLSHLIPSFAALMMLSYFSLAELAGGLAGITGAYFAGLFHRMGDKKHSAEKSISPYVNTFLLPLFLGSVGMQVDIGVLGFQESVVVLVILVVAIISKLLGCYATTAFANLFKKENKWSGLESYLFGSSMVARGEVGLVIATILNSTHLMTSTQYVVCVAVIVLTTIASPIMLAFGFSKLEKKEKEKEIETKKVKKPEFFLKIGPFSFFSSKQIFDIISTTLENTEEINSIVQLSEGRKVLTLSENVKIILKPGKGIIFEGNEEKIRKIMTQIKDAINKDIKRFQ